MLFSGGEGGIRTHAGFPPNGFQDRLVMTTSILLHRFFYRIESYHKHQGVVNDKIIFLRYIRENQKFLVAF